MNTHQKKEPWKLPSQPEQAKDAMELRSGKVLFDPAPLEIFDNPINVSGDRVVSSDNDRNAKVGVGTSKGPEVVQRDTSKIHKTQDPYVPPIPFPGRL